MTSRLWLLVLLLLAWPLQAAQFAYPTADNIDGSWSTTNGTTACTATDCTTEIDEGEDTPSVTGTEDQANWIVSSAGTSGTDTYETSITALSTPSNNTVTVRWSDWLEETGGGAGSSCTLNIYIYEDTTLRHSCTATSPVKNAWNARTCSTSGGWSSSVPSDWSTLEIRAVWNMSSAGKSCATRISWFELEAANAAGGEEMMVIGEITHDDRRAAR